MTELQCSALEYIYMYFNFKKSFRSTRSLMSSGRGGVAKHKRFLIMKKVFLKGYIVPVCVYTMACEHLDTVQLSAIKFLAKVILAISTCHGEMDRIKF